jgi:hypothetical protein
MGRVQQTGKHPIVALGVAGCTPFSLPMSVLTGQRRLTSPSGRKLPYRLVGGFPGVRSTIERVWANLHAVRRRPRPGSKRRPLQQQYKGIGAARRVDSDVRRLTNRADPPAGARRVVFAAERKALVARHRAMVVQALVKPGQTPWTQGELLTPSRSQWAEKVETCTIHPLAWKAVTRMLQKGWKPVQADVACCITSPVKLQTAADALWWCPRTSRLVVVEIKKWDPVLFRTSTSQMSGCLSAFGNSPLCQSQSQVALTAHLVAATYDLSAIRNGVHGVVFNVHTGGADEFPLDARMNSLVPTMLQELSSS